MRRLAIVSMAVVIGALHGMVSGWWFGGFVLHLPNEDTLLVIELMALSSVVLVLVGSRWRSVALRMFLVGWAVFPLAGLVGGTGAWVIGRVVAGWTGREWPWDAIVHAAEVFGTLTAVVALRVARRRLRAAAGDRSRPAVNDRASSGSVAPPKSME